MAEATWFHSGSAVLLGSVAAVAAYHARGIWATLREQSAATAVGVLVCNALALGSITGSDLVPWVWPLAGGFIGTSCGLILVLADAVLRREPMPRGMALVVLALSLPTLLLVVMLYVALGFT